MRSTSGITCCHFFCSAVFSMPVWRYPMVGDAERTVSPSSVSTRRSTPCVLGCCGPMLTVMVSVRRPGSCSGVVVASATAGQPISFDVGGEFLLRDLERLRHVRRPADLHRRVLPERKA